MVAYVKTETTTENVVTEIYKTKVSEALTTKLKEAELLTCQQPTLRQIQEQAVTKNATKLLTFNYNNMKTILDKINKADEIQAKKVELGKHEVELNVIEDFLKSLAAAQDLLKSSANDVVEVRKSLEPILRKLEMAKSAFSRSEMVGSNTIKQVKALGLELPSNFGAAYDRLAKDAKRTEDSIKKLTSLKTDLAI